MRLDRNEIIKCLAFAAGYLAQAKLDSMRGIDPSWSMGKRRKYQIRLAVIRATRNGA